MPTPTNESVVQHLKAVAAGAVEVRRCGDELTERIKEFEAWMNTVPGRVTTGVTLESLKDEQTDLMFSRNGRGWSLHVVRYSKDDTSIIASTPLRDSTLEMKAFAIARFPSLLEAMSKSQADLVACVRKATTEFDSFAKSIGMKVGA